MRPRARVPVASFMIIVLVAAAFVATVPRAPPAPRSATAIAPASGVAPVPQPGTRTLKIGTVSAGAPSVRAWQPSSAPAGTGSAPGALAAPSVGAQWTGIGERDDVNLTPYTVLAPPDVQVAAGPNDVVEMVNVVMRVWTKGGSFVANRTLTSLFQVPSTEFISDPKVQYDTASGRWFASVTDLKATQVLLAVSSSSDPTSGWKVYPVPVTATGECLDQPILGVGTTTVILSVNVFTQTPTSFCTTPYLGAQYWVINKTDLVAGVASPRTQGLGPDMNEFSIHPVQIQGSSAAHYMVSTYWPGAATTSTTLHLFNVTGTPPATVNVAVSSFTMPVAAVPPSASQLGTRDTLDTGDIRIADAVWSAGKLWLGFDEACLLDPTRACIRLVQIDTQAGIQLQDFDLTAAGRDVFYPGLRLDGAGDMAVVFGYSSSSDYPGVMISGQLATDLPATYQSPQIVVAGTGPEVSACTKTLCRYGDYFGAGADPSDASVLWLAGELGTPSGWSTHVFSFAVKAALTLSYQVSGGGTGYSAPVLSYMRSGVRTRVALSTTPATYTLDGGTPWSVDLQLPGSSNGELWAVNASAGAPPSSGYANASSTTLVLRYFHQYAVQLSYSIAGGSSSSIAPAVRVTRWGVTSLLNISASPTAGLDVGSPYAYPLLIPASTGDERWMAVTAVAGNVTGTLSLSATYYHQYRVTFDYSVQGGWSGGPPAVHYGSFGANVSVSANATTWADAAQPYVFDAALPGGGVGVRTGAGPGAVGHITGAVTFTVVYRTQYLLTVTANPADLAGDVSGGGWIDAGNLSTLQALAPSGWMFVGWSGGASGNARTITVTMQGPANVSALFYPGLTITAGEGGAVAYAYGAVTGTVAAGTSATVFVPPGTVVTLTATSASWTQAFGGWSGAAVGPWSPTTVTVSRPAAVSASFGASAVILTGVALAVVTVIVIALLLAFLARRRRNPPPPRGRA